MGSESSRWTLRLSDYGRNFLKAGRQMNQFHIAQLHTLFYMTAQEKHQYLSHETEMPWNDLKISKIGNSVTFRSLSATVLQSLHTVYQSHKCLAAFSHHFVAPSFLFACSWQCHSVWINLHVFCILKLYCIFLIWVANFLSRVSGASSWPVPPDNYWWVCDDLLSCCRRLYPAHIAERQTCCHVIHNFNVLSGFCHLTD